MSATFDLADWVTERKTGDHYEVVGVDHERDRVCVLPVSVMSTETWTEHPDRNVWREPSLFEPLALLRAQGRKL